MSKSGATTKKARAEVENVIDELVLTIEDGVSRPDGRAGFKAREAERLRARLRSYAETIVDAARGRTGADIDASVAAVVETIGKGVSHPKEGARFGTAEAAELHGDLRMFADAIVTAAHGRARAGIDAPIDQVVKTIRSGLFSVYGRAPYAAITADQLEAYLETFVDAVLTVLEQDDATDASPVGPPRSGPA